MSKQSFPVQLAIVLLVAAAVYYSMESVIPNPVYRIMAAAGSGVVATVLLSSLL